MQTTRRSFVAGLIAAPAVVKFASLMPVRGIIAPYDPAMHRIGLVPGILARQSSFLSLYSKEISREFIRENLFTPYLME